MTANFLNRTWTPSSNGNALANGLLPIQKHSHVACDRHFDTEDTNLHCYHTYTMSVSGYALPEVDDPMSKSSSDEWSLLAEFPTGKPSGPWHHYSTSTAQVEVCEGCVSTL